MRLFRMLLLSLLCLPGVVTAQERARTILVLDASGSMWGQIDGVAKITIAQQVIGDLLQSLPADQDIGLSAYGHRQKGECGDIEMLALPGAATREEIGAAVDGITPRGKTPLSDAVTQAAEALKYTEEKATVVLVSDGRETCEADPCAVGRALEQSGVDFTVHVVGFDVEGDPEALGQLQCLAEETGGRFLSAANAEELGSALEVVAKPESFEVTLRALAGDGGPQIEEPLMWEMTGGGEAVVDFERGATLTREVMAGDYTVSVLRPADEATAEAEVTVEGAQTITLVLPAPLPDATVEGPESAPQGATVEVSWEGPGDDRDYIGVSKPDADRTVNYTYLREGNPLPLQMPPDPGDYELRYYDRETGVLATQPITVTPVEASVEAPERAAQGATIEVPWTGPDYSRDYIAVSEPDSDRSVNYTYTREGSPLPLQMPPDPGTYEVRYVMTQGNRVLASRMIEVTPAEVTLDAAAQANAGAALEVAWEGPGYNRDYIAISKPDSDRSETYTYVGDGSPLQVKVPLETGAYELRYVMTQGNRVLASQPLEVVAVGAELTLPEEAGAGANIVVDWDGPGYKGDYISVAATDQPDDKYVNYTYTREGAPLLLQMPPEPGDYEVRYVATGDGRSVLAREPVTVTEVSAALDAPESVPAGGMLPLHWEGPDYKGDYIALFKEGEEDYRGYLYTTEDSPMVMETPEGPGAYELRYIMGQGKRVLARHPVELTYEPE